MTVRRPLLLALLTAVLAAAVPAAAHTQVQRATPGPGETVVAGVDVAVLDFLDPVQADPIIVVTGPDGSVVPGLEDARLIADDVARVGFDPLPAGRYQVDYEFVALDGATQEAAHQFTVEASSGLDVDLRPLLAWIVGIVLLGLLVVALLGRRRATA